MSIHFLLIVLFLIIVMSSSQEDKKLYSSRLFPVESQLVRYLDKELLNASRNNKLIPRIIWLAVSNASDELPGHMNDLFHRNHGWLIKVVGNAEKDLFMNTVFNETKIQWAYNMINPALGAAKADVWRYVRTGYSLLYISH
jgi:hypothetical protein